MKKIVRLSIYFIAVLVTVALFYQGNLDNDINDKRIKKVVMKNCKYLISDINSTNYSVNIWNNIIIQKKLESDIGDIILKVSKIEEIKRFALLEQQILSEQIQMIQEYIDYYMTEIKESEQLSQKDSKIIYCLKKNLIYNSKKIVEESTSINKKYLMLKILNIKYQISILNNYKSSAKENNENQLIDILIKQSNITLNNTYNLINENYE